ncbi:MAG: hypothetical protein DYG92_04455 [Leptolyngbya sp. PLA1]|nr:hypothetical protein [Leptolyngbya sp. PLA1]
MAHGAESPSSGGNGMSHASRCAEGVGWGRSGATVRRVGSLVGAAVLGAMMGGCPAKPPAPPPAPAPTPAPPAKVVKDPSKVLEASRKALGEAVALSYSAGVEGQGALKDKVDAYTAQVIAAKVQAEGGGWKLYLRGACRPADPQTLPSEFEIGYDGSTVRSLRPLEQAVYERDNVVEMDELAVFLGGQSVKPPVAWELLGEVPLDAKGGTLAFEGQEKADGVICDVVRITPAAEGGAPAAGDTSEREAGLRVYIAEHDHLPRRIERLVTLAGVDGARVLKLDELKVTTPERAEVSMVSFVLEAPSDFTHRTVQAALNKPAGGDAEPEPSDLDLAMEPLAVGTPAPDWTLPMPDGSKVSLSSHAGKVVVLDFWGTWCPFCLKAMPQIQKLHDAYKDKGVVVLGLNTENDPSADPAGFMKQKKYTYGLVLNAEKVTRPYRVFGFPTLYVIGRDGNIALVEQGAKPDLYETVSRVIDEELGL